MSEIFASAAAYIEQSRRMAKRIKNAGLREPALVRSNIARRNSLRQLQTPPGSLHGFRSRLINR
jgi:hypothetical protein